MPALESLPGKIGPYRLLEKIGEGGMGVVYLARDYDGRPVAVKVLGPAVSTDPNARRRLFREVETMRRVRSRYVAEILDADVGGPSPYIVTRYVPGRTLDDVVRKDGPLRGAELAQLAAGLAAALTAIHAAGVVHRDLKPGNVMLVDGQPVVIDFGIAHIPDATRLTQTGMVMGTPGYLAPEVIEGQPSSGASDVHSWGATVAFAATGKQPYGAGTYQTIFFRVLQGNAELDGVPAPLLPLVAAALDVDPRKRPPAQWLAAQCAGLRLAAPAAVGPDGTLLASVAVPWRQDVDSSPPRPTGFQAGSSPLRPAGFQTARPAYPGPAEAAAGVADLLPPVDYSRPDRAAPPPAAPGNGGTLLTPAAPGERAQPAGHGPAGAYEPVGGRGQAAGAQVGGHGLVLLALGVGAVALSVLLPVAGTVLALAAITLLRAADRAQAGLTARRSVRGAQPSDIVVVVATAPWTVVRALLTTVALAPFALFVAGAAAVASVVFVHTRTLPQAGSWAAGAIVAWYAVGPGSGSPRRQLRRMSAAVIRGRGSMAVAIIACWALALAVVSSALSQPPLIWPATSWMLPNVLPSLGGTLHSVQQWLLSHTVGMLHVP
jgi:serine/threonine kinase PknH